MNRISQVHTFSSNQAAVANMEKIFDFGNGSPNNNLAFGRQGTSSTFQFQVNQTEL